MNYFCASSLFSKAKITAGGAILAAAAVSLAGCGGIVSFPNADVTPAAQTSTGTLGGSNFGGHAPLVGAHVFMLEGYTSASGYYQPAKDLLSSATGVSVEPAGTAVAGYHYVTTNAQGVFNVNNYTCDAGYPVYFYAEGGNPQTGSNASSITSATVNSATTITLTGSNLFYQGEKVTFLGSGGTFGNYINGYTGVVTTTNLTTTTFQITVGSLTNNGTTLVNGTTYTGGTLGGVIGTGQASPSANNPAVVNLAVVGICPGGTNSLDYLNFVYMNEVSTAAAAYALGGFFPAPGTAGLTVAGAAAANLSIPASDNLALLGIQNAAITASQLYDIQGSNSACSGASCDGETHIARTVTPGVQVNATSTSTGSPTVPVSTTAGLQVGVTITGPTLPAGETITAIGSNSITLSTGTNVTAGTNVLLSAGAGSGTVPQATLDTVGNILANCVDSANTSTTASTQCTSLFGYAKSAGTSGTNPIDTASAAIDIAHNPWANVTPLVTLPTGNTPFSPFLGTANDLSVGIKYTPAHVNNPEGIALDKLGNVWYANAHGITAGGYVTALTPFGGVLYNTQAVATQVPHYPAFDGNGYVWYGDAMGSQLVSLTGAGVLRGSYQYSNGGIPTPILSPYAVVVDGVNSTGYVYVEDATNGSVDYFDGNGVTLGTVPQMATCLGGQHADHAAIDNASNGQNLFASSEIGGFICKPIRTSTVGYPATAYAKYTPTTAASIHSMGIDASGNVYASASGTDQVLKVPVGAANGTAPTVLTGGTLSTPFGMVVDGAGNIFITNRGGNSVTQFTSTAAVSSVNYTGNGSTGNGSLFADPLNLVADPAGALWVTNYNGSAIVELLGVAAPTYAPLSTAITNNKLGSKP